MALRNVAGRLLGPLSSSLRALEPAPLSELTRQMGTERRPGLSGAWKQSKQSERCCIVSLYEEHTNQV